MLFIKDTSKVKDLESLKKMWEKTYQTNTNQKKANKAINIRQNRCYSSIITRCQKNDINQRKVSVQENKAILCFCLSKYLKQKLTKL